MFQTHLFSSMTPNILRLIYLQKIFLMYKQFKIVREIQITTLSPKRVKMILILKLSVSVIHRKLSFRSVIKMKLKEMIFELNKMKITISNIIQINQGKLKHLKPTKTS